MAQSLYSTVLKNYTYDDLKELCFAPGSNFGNSFDCDWEVWRDKAVADFGVSPEFFDLIRTLSGPQRYLQIASYVKLTPLSGVRVYQDTGVIEGVYEAYTGYLESKERRDADMMLWFYQRVGEEQKRYLSIMSGFSKKEMLEEIELRREKWQEEERKEEEFLSDPGRERSKYLRKIIEEGRIDILDEIIHGYFTLPEGFSIERNIPYIPFWQISSQQLEDLPLQPHIEDKEARKIIQASMQSSNTRIVDFFRSIFRDRNLEGFTKSTSTKNGLLRHGKPEETYGIALRFFGPKTNVFTLEHMAELFLYFSQSQATYHYYTAIINRRKGDITFLQAVLPYTEPKYFSYLETRPEFLTLSRSLIEEYAQDKTRQSLVYHV
ncbi:Hypothetical protein BQ3484_169 [Cedratvirus A11]|uniref:Uncharacterized protein n=1 Tax=Cedratvirus A11 TaxID=1903266 RepID=A0A1M7XU99_9VIRU|nr:Hypothetical protein BQ3484_169 [Cedratvirus A11]SHO33237.1 Hypothetical protein BQ3484_169 [Cedratvirus A11]